jgi:hypothetical protein
MSILQVQREAMAIGVATPKNIYNSAKRLAENAGFSDGNEFFTDPMEQQQQPQPNPLVEVEQVKQQSQQQLKQMDMQADAQKFQAETQVDLQTKEMEIANQKAIESAKILSQERIKAAEIEASKEAKLMELAAGIISAQISSASNVDDTTKIDQMGAIDPNMEIINQVMQSIQGMAASLSAPKYIVRDENGRAIGVQTGASQ